MITWALPDTTRRDTSIPRSVSESLSSSRTWGSTTTPSAITDVTCSWRMPEGISRSFRRCSPAWIVCPALLPPWHRTTRSHRRARRSMAFPLPSSPHCVPTRIVTGTSRFYPGPSRRPGRIGAGRPIRGTNEPSRTLPLDAEPDPDVRVVLLDLVALHLGRGLQDLHGLDA